MPPLETNLFDRTTHWYWFNSKNFRPIRMYICMNYPMRDYIAFTQNRINNWAYPTSISLHLLLQAKRF